MLTDPSALSHITESLKNDVGSMIAASPTITSDAAARVQGELVPKMVERIAKTAVYGMATNNPKETLAAIQRGDFDKYLDGEGKLQAQRYAEQQQKAQQADENRNYELAKRQEADTAATAHSDYISRLNGTSNEGERRRLVSQAMADQRFNRFGGMKENIRAFSEEVTRQVRDKVDTTPHPEEYRQALNEMFDTARDRPNNLSVQPIRDLFRAGKLNPQEEAQLEARFNALDKPFERNFHDQVLRVERAITSNQLYGPLFVNEPGKLASIVTRIEDDARRQVDEAKKSGRDVTPLLDPNSPQYLFTPAKVQTYLPSAGKLVGDQAAAARGKEKSIAAPTVERVAVNPQTGERLVFRDGKWQKQ